MKECRTYNIKNRVFRRDDILALANVLEEELKKSEEASTVAQEPFRGELLFNLSCNDDTSYRYHSYDLWSAGGIIDRKHVSSIHMHYMQFDKDREIEILLNRDPAHQSGFLRVHGTDRKWMDEVFRKLENMIKSVPPQNAKIRVLATIWVIPASIGYGMALACVVFLLGIARKYSFGNNQPISFSTVYSTIFTEFGSIFWMCLPLSLFFAVVARNRILNLWPKIEFNFGPDNQNRFRLQRTRLIAVWSTMVLPILVTGCYEILKLAFFKFMQIS